MKGCEDSVLLRLKDGLSPGRALVLQSPNCLPPSVPPLMEFAEKFIPDLFPVKLADLPFFSEF